MSDFPMQTSLFRRGTEMKNTSVSLRLSTPAMLMLFALTWSSVALAQGAPNEYQIGFPLNGEFSGTNFEQVQMNNGNLHIEIPLWSAAGRGPLVGFKYVYDSLGWGFNETCDRLSGTCHDVVTFHPSKAGLAANHLALGIVGPQSFTFR